MTLKIYGAARSRASHNIWLAEELGLPYEIVDIKPADAHADARLRALNPNARVPAIDDDGTVLWESMAINLYLIGKHGGPLGPVEQPAEDRNRENGEILMWTFWVVNEVEPVALQALRNAVLLPEDKRDPALVTAAFETLARPLRVLNDALADHEYLVGDRFTVADLNVCGLIGWPRVAGMDFTPYPNIKAWARRCSSRPAAQKLAALRG
jgi:glutathione S-transferase